jgi:6-phosphogluconolactonase
VSRLIRIFPTPEALRVASGLAILGAMEDAIRSRGTAYVALAGGSTPAGTYGWLADRTSFSWENVHLFWGDERCVPPDHPDSNFRMARNTLLDKLPPPGPHIHPVRGTLPPDEAAALYEGDIRDTIPSGADGIPRFDIVLLGLGEDGHTASLFPGTAAVEEGVRLTAAGFAPTEPSRRVTVTFPLINAARKVVFLVDGPGKAAVVRDVLEGPAGRFPAQVPAPAGGPHWYLDAAAASLLHERNRA